MIACLDSISRSARPFDLKSLRVPMARIHSMGLHFVYHPICMYAGLILARSLHHKFLARIWIEIKPIEEELLV